MNTPKTLALAFLLALSAPAWAQQAVNAEEQAMLDEEARLDAEEAALDAAPRLDPTAPDPAPAHPELRPVLEDFGGREGLDRLMDTFMAGLLADEQMGPFFANADQERVKRQLAEQFCVILGGDCEYSGRDMKTSHAGMGVDRADFNRLVEVLQVAMDEHGVPFRAQNKLLAKLAPMHREVVTE
ncbi:MAG TPA: group 1 truncated hemoglobin [Arenimonas sp.]|nr:group 1 truncated hemoglobin [Arenimonas sp.]